ncbi:hypothetical protein [Streptomyces sp. NPDC088733]|uniref:hypothetical protein n=1 Tax=Streptomyces sp. NPDC088733 TaxID=3365880 RepID=UPI0037FC7BB8
MSNTESGNDQGLGYYPWWLDKPADNVTGQGSFIDNGPIQGPEAVRAVVTAARGLYEFQDFAYTGDYGDNGFIEEYRTQVKGEPLHVVVTVARNAAGECEKLVVNHRPRNAMLLFSREMHREFAGTSLAEHFLADGS